LEKSLLIWRGKDGVDYPRSRYLEYSPGQPNGIIDTRIDCYPPSDALPKSCQHRFLNGGWHYYFRHRPEDVPNWREMQKRLLDLLASFAVGNASSSR
jgi:hypothetical protein